MAISFDSLPNSIPAATFHVPEGKYLAKIEKAEMRQPKDVNKPPYLSIMWNVFDANNKPLGKFFDGMYESESPYVQFKLRKFVEALGVNLGSVFELKDLAKVCQNKVCVISLKDDQTDPERSVINIFDQNCYAAPHEVRPPEPKGFVDYDPGFTDYNGSGTAESSY